MRMQQLHVVRVGTGEPILVLHGLYSDHRQMLPLIPALHGYEAFIPDLLGHGASSKVPSTSIIEDNTDLLRTLCKAQGIRAVIAYSTSGLIALELQLPHTIFVSSFCTNPLTEGPLKRLHGQEERIRNMLITNRERAQQFFSKTLTRDVVMPGTRQASVECAIDYLTSAQRDFTDLAKRIPHAMVIHGTKDWLVDYHLGAVLAQAAHAPLLFVPEDHWSILRNKTVHGAISTFLREASARPSRASVRARNARAQEIKARASRVDS